jgi:hypothetical protein
MATAAIIIVKVLTVDAEFFGEIVGVGAALVMEFEKQ